MRVESFLLESARRFPGKTALVAGPARLSYQDLAARAAAFAAELHKQGIVRGDRVVIFLHNSPEAVIAV
ncbi:MAG TPA: AMP-binding protein, partial [Burkholderiales bacterium]